MRVRVRVWGQGRGCSSVEPGPDPFRHVLGVALVKVAQCEVVGHDHKVLPRRRRPVRVVIALLGAFEPRALSVWVLARVRRFVTAVTVQILVGDVEPLVSLARLAVLIPGERFMQTALTLTRVLSRGRLALRSAGGAVNPRELETVPQSWRRVGPRSVVAHVLDADFALYVALFAAASVLIGPLQLEDAALQGG